MRIGVRINDGAYKNLNLKNPNTGNPGIGGSEYSLTMLACTYANFHPQDEVFVIHKEKTNRYSDNICCKLIEHDDQIPEVLLDNKIDIIVLINALYDAKWYQAVKEAHTKIIFIMANFMQPHHLAQYRKNDVVSRIVFVGKEQYSWCIDDEIIQKSYIIGNMINNAHDKTRVISDDKPIVTYMGSLVPQKGFHLLAKQWKHIVQEVPNAQLYVIGSGKLYNSNNKMGSYGIASDEYEREFMPYLLDENGKLLSSVHFMGTMGIEKEEILLRTWVGVPNPSAETETFCNCAVEMEGYGIPIVTKAKNSFFDVTQNGYSSLLYYTEYGFRRKLIKLLKNKNLNQKMGQHAVSISDQFTPEKLITKWEAVFQDIVEEQTAPYIGRHRHLFYNGKILRIINRYFRMHLHLKQLPTTIEGFRSGLKRR